MPHDALLSEVLLILLTAVCVVAIFKKMNLSPVLGYFVAGGVIGEHGFKIVSSEETSILGEMGVVFLLFAIGLELTFERLKSMRSHVFGFGSLQVILTSLAIATFVYLMNNSLGAAVIVGGGLALSSTAIVMQVLAENREQSTQVGRLSLAILLMQDFAVVPLLVIVPLLAGEQSGLLKPMGEALFKALVALVLIFALGRLMLRPLFNMISSSNSAKSNELFVAATLLIALGAAWGTQEMGLSLALGAFVAGLLVAETEFHLQAEESIAPFKGLLLGLFFMSVGMSINLRLIAENIVQIGVLSLLLVTVKAVIITLLCILFRFSIGNAIHTGLLLSQGGEFAFILFRLAQRKDVIDNELGQMLLLIVTITMAFTPMFAAIGSWVAVKFDTSSKMDSETIYKEIADLGNHVIILGFGRVGKMVARVLEAENVNYVAIDVNSEHVYEERKEGYPVYLGDASSVEMLNSVGIDRAGSVIITLDNEVTLKKASKIISSTYPNLPIVVRSKDLSDSEEVYKSGAKIIVPEVYETGLQLGGAVLKSIGVSEFEVSRVKNRFRLGNYLKLPKDDDVEVISTEVQALPSKD